MAPRRADLCFAELGSRGVAFDGGFCMHGFAFFAVSGVFELIRLLLL